MAEKFSHWLPAEDLHTDENINAYFAICVKEDPGDGSLIRSALVAIANSPYITKLAEDAWHAQEYIYITLSENVNPELKTIVKVVKAFDLSLPSSKA